ncbi:poly(A)-specific ribonuclease PARN [Neltuma alba]|uniref:poly(A)-specific ribonuclease PARN n=1 Tax=Neltuma alba TaxID=207710 RepID=UPI0010A3F5C7|nr:poly(A)-specific ribonuclease PARN-like [Prosopis alba]
MKARRVTGWAIARAFSSASSASLPQSGPAFPLKTVTKSNFEASIAELRHHVRASDFVAIDLEMTGITSAPWRESFEFDRSDVRYLKVKDSADKFAVVQFGVCPFRWDSASQLFVAYPYNFYVFPREELAGLGPRNEFLCQTSSIDFLAKYQFDFNACIHEGISYLSREQESEAIRCLNSSNDDEWLDEDSRLGIKNVKDIASVSIADVLFTERMKNKFSEWRDGLFQEQEREDKIQRLSEVSKQQLQVIFYKMRPALRLCGFTSHQLKLIKLVVRSHFKDLFYVSVNSEDSGLQHMVVYTDSRDELKSLLKEVKDRHQREVETKIQAAVGFRHVIDLLSSEQKLIVGHNCFLDIAHVYSKFIGPLPRTAEEFVSSVNKYFPYVVDTKMLLNSNNLLQTRMKGSPKSLASVFSFLCPQIAVGFKSSDLASSSSMKVEVQVNDLRSSSWNPGGKHEAGYDAFMTGCVFAQLCSHLGVNFKLNDSSQHLALSDKIRKYINLLYLNWLHGDVIDLNTGDKVADFGVHTLKRQHHKILFENVVLIWGLPFKLKTSEVRDCITKVYGPTSVVSVYRLDETAVFVQLSKTELVSDFLSLKETLERQGSPLSAMHPLAKLLEGGNTCAASYETYKEICGSPLSEVLFADQAKAAGIEWKTQLVEHKADLETVEKTEPTTLDQLRNAVPHDQVSNDEFMGSFCATEVNQIKTANLR